MKKIITIGVDCRDLLKATTGTKTYLYELIAQFKQTPSTTVRFVYLHDPFPVPKGRTYFHKFLEHILFFIWKQLVLPIKAFLKGCDIVFCTDYFLPLVRLGFKTVVVFHDAFFWEYPVHYNKIWLRLFHLIAVRGAKKSNRIIKLYQMNKLISVQTENDILPQYRNTPISKLLEYHNLDRKFETYQKAELLVGMCMDNRKHLHMPDNFAFIIRSGGANLRYSEFKVSYAIAVVPLFISASVHSRDAARCKYVKRICPLRMRGYSAAIGSFTLIIMSAFCQTSSAVAIIFAPAAM